MKFFLRGAFALGIFGALASTAMSDTPRPANLPSATPVAQPVNGACPPATNGTVISSGHGRIFGGRLFGGRVGGGYSGFSGSHVSGLSSRLDVASDRIDQFMQKG